MSHYVNSESIFSVIGDYPVTDQYDILYSNLQAGSTYDNYVTGSLLTKVNVLGTPTFIQGIRGLAFSKLTVERHQRPSPLLTSNAAYNLQPWRERAGTIRNVRLFSNAERFYDSLTPNLVESFNTLGGKIIRVDFSLYGFGVHNQIVFDNDLFNPYEEITGLSPIGFEASFPFEPAFSKVKRDKSVAESFVSRSELVGATLVQRNEYKTSKLLIVELSSGSNFSGSTVPVLTPYTPYPGTSFDANYWVDNLRYTLFGDGTPARETTKILFGFGDRRSIKLQKFLGIDIVVGRNNLVGRRFSPIPDGSGYYLSLGAIVRGWKYGLIDGNPHYTSCVFRRDRFGQFRDMLEQRLNSTFTHDENNAPLRYSGGVEQPALSAAETSKSQLSVGGFSLSSAATSLPSIDSVINDSPVRVNFTRLTYIENTRELAYFSEKPENTWSSNLSLYATSSLPYFDDISRNRNQITTPPGTIVLSSLSDLFGNTTIGT